MRTGAKVWLIIAACLVLIGCLLFAGLMTSLKWDFNKLATVKYSAKTYEIIDAFDSISMNTDTADIVFALSDDGTCKVECHEAENENHSVAVKDGTLVIELVDKKSVADYIYYIGINNDSPKITVYLPKSEYSALSIHEDTGDIEIPGDFTFKNVELSSSTGDVDLRADASGTIKIKTSTGDIRVEDISAGELDLSVSTGTVNVSGVSCKGDVRVKVSTGKAYLTDVACKNLISSGGTGDISLVNVLAAEKFSIKRSTGDVRFDSADAAEILIETDTGDVEGSLCSDKVFIAQSNTGDIDVPRTTAGGICEIISDTGDIRIKIG